MTKRIIYNDDFRTPMSFDQVKFGYPASVQDWRDLIERVRGTGVTSYVMDSIEFDNKVYFATKRGVDWAKIDFDSFDGEGADQQIWRDGDYARAGRVIQAMRAQGHEPLQIFIDSCRDMGMEALAGIRMNDCHGIEPLSKDSPDVSFFLKKHPELALVDPGTGEPTRLADYGKQAVRDYRFSIIEELLEAFDYDGIELNWLRFPYLFQPDYLCGAFGFVTEERFTDLAPIMTQWICEVRTLLDHVADKNGRGRMCLGVRVPETPEITRAVGIDLPAWIHEAKLDYIVPSGFHATHFNIPVQDFKALCRGSRCAVYPCVFPNVCQWPKTTRTCQTKVYAAAAQSYYGAGADGIEVFNHFHPACRVVGLPFNREVLDVIASPERVSRYPRHHYYIMYSGDRPDVPERSTLFMSGYRGTRIPVQPLVVRQMFAFRFGDDLTESGRTLDRLRFKIFDMSPDDACPSVDLNDVRLACDLSWRQRFLYRHTHVPPTQPNGPIDGKKVGWHIAESDESLELLAGQVIPKQQQNEALQIIDTPANQRPEMVAQINGVGEGFGRDVFMLVEANVASIPPSALRKGLNRLWVQIETRRDTAQTELYMGELEIVTLGS